MLCSFSLSVVERCTRLLVVTFLVGASSFCTRDSRSDTAGALASSPASLRSAATSTGYVDSILPIEEQLRRFRIGVDSAAVFSGGAHSRNALVRRFTLAIARSDTNALREMLLTRAEFAYIYYPVSPYTKPPYRQSPQLVWFQTQVASEQGIVRALRRLGGKPLEITGYECNPEPKRWGRIHVWEECLVRWPNTPNTGGIVTQRRLFGAVAEYGGQFKFVSYANGY